MKIVASILVWWLGIIAATAQTNQSWQICRNPIRIFDQRTSVNLSPLFQWWSSQPVPTNAASFAMANINLDTNAPDSGSDRPLLSWHRVTGVHTATVGGSWVVNAVIYTSPSARTNARIILNHPPNGEEKYYTALKAQLVQAIQQLTNSVRDYDAAVKGEQVARKRADAARRSPSKQGPTLVNEYSRLAAQERQKAKTADEQRKQLETMLAEMVGQMKKIPAYGSTYQVDWFALMQGRTQQGLPVYDLGIVGPTP